MNILVFSDTHRRTDEMLHLIKEQKPDRVLHLGDCVADAREAAAAFPGIPVDSVGGNNDFLIAAASFYVLRLLGSVIYMAHGHRHGVYSGLSMLLEKAGEHGADIVLFGHTHTPFLERRGPIWVMNPGSLSRPRAGAPTYGRITILPEGTRCDIAPGGAFWRNY